MKKIVIAALVATCFVGLVALPVAAQGVWDVCPSGVSSASELCGDKTQATDIVKRLINLFLYAIGVLSVILIIHSGLKYVNSRGDAEGVKSAKNTLLYAVIGLIVAMLAFTIVNFVIGAFGGNSPANSGNQTLQENQEVNVDE